MRRGAVALLAALALAGCGEQPPVVVTAPPPGAPPLHVGVVVNALDAEGARDDYQAAVRELGAGWIREELRWPEIEPAPGVFDWSSFDALLASAAAHRLRVLPLLIGTPAWAGSSHLALPGDPAAFGAFAAHAAARYGPGGTFWHAHPELDGDLAPRWFELWNEPYLERFSTGGVDPARYAQMVRAALVDGRAANPGTRWLMAGELAYEDAAGEPHGWLEAIAAADPQLLADVDGVAVHPYGFGAPGGDEEVELRYRFDRIDAIARRLPAGTQVWITELGWSTCELRPDCTSEREQAQRLADVFARVRRPPLDTRVRALFVYHLRDFPGRSEDDREGHYGLLRTDGTRKPAWSVVRAATRAPRGSSRSAP